MTFSSQQSIYVQKRVTSEKLS